MGTPWDPDRKGNYRIGLPMKLIELAKQASEISGLYVEWQDLAEDAEFYAQRLRALLEEIP